MNILIVDNAYDPSRIDRWLKKKFPNVPVSLIHKFIRKKYIKLNDEKTSVDAKVVNGSKIAISREWDERPIITGARTVNKDSAYRQKLALLKDNIIYKDDHIIVLNKPYGLAVQGGSKINISIDDLADDLKFELKQKPKLVHRLDKDTSGIFLLARTDQAARELAAGFKEKTIVKKYWAIVVGVPRAKEGSINLPIAKKQSEAMERADIDYADGKDAITTYRVLDCISKKVAWLEMTPITGRTHQLRVHATTLNTPILGDGKYGGKEAFISGASNKLHLHACEIAIKNFMGKNLHFVAEPPTHIEETLELFGFR